MPLEEGGLALVWCGHVAEHGPFALIGGTITFNLEIHFRWLTNLPTPVIELFKLSVMIKKLWVEFFSFWFNG